MTYYDVSQRGDVMHVIPFNFLIRVGLKIQSFWRETVVHNDCRMITDAGWSDAFDQGYEAGLERGKFEALNPEPRPHAYYADWDLPVRRQVARGE